MKDYSSEIEKIKQNLSGTRDIEIRRKAGLLLGVMSAKNIRLGCRSHGVCPKTFYDWRKKLKVSDYDLSVLKNRPRGSRISPKRTAQKTVRELVKSEKKQEIRVDFLFLACITKGQAEKLLIPQLIISLPVKVSPSNTGQKKPIPIQSATLPQKPLTGSKWYRA